MSIATIAPDIKQKAAISSTDIAEVVRQIVERFHPIKIVLFGSYAYGNPHEGSDIDILVVMDTPLREVDQAIEICQSIHYWFGIDLLVRTPAVIMQRLRLGDPFIKEILTQGKVLYESAG
jgi:uncharacterized protein